jgi:two-component system OmpR family sensor kinase
VAARPPRGAGDRVGDAARLHQVVANLLANARTHTPSGTRVTASVAARADGGAVVAVLDDGPGIPAPLVGRIFERFTRGDDSRGRSTGSTGLGLSIVAAVAAAHGGTVPGPAAPAPPAPAAAAAAAVEHHPNGQQQS